MNVTKKIISICVIISVLSPIVSYVYFENRVNSKISSENERLMGIIENLNQENENLTQRLDDAENLIKPYLVTNLGWYLHDSTDPVNSIRNTFTIYGSVVNTGRDPALDCKLVIQFYNNQTLLQTSEFYMGIINGTKNVLFDNNNHFYIARETIHCNVADLVTRIEITPKWS